MTIFAKIIRHLDSEVRNGIQALIGKANLLAAQRDEAERELLKAREEIADLRYKLGKTQEELHATTLDAQYLSLSHKLADNPQALAEARAILRRLIAKVDKAIGMLREDARI